MAVVVETGAGVSGANSYLSEATFVTMCAGRPGSDVAAALATSEITKLLVSSCMGIETNVSWFGSPVLITDRICRWPRTGVKMKEGVATFANNVIPLDLIQAQFEYAFQLFSFKLLDQGKSDITSMSVTGMTVGLKTKDSVGSRQDSIPTIVYDLLRPYGQFRTDEPSFQLSRHLWG